MSNYILLVFEGAKTEVKIFDNLKSNFLNEHKSTIVHAIYGGCIYSLYNRMQKDPDLDLFSLLKESHDNDKVLEKIEREQVSEVYLFFDYDGHAPDASDEKIEDMLKVFSNETESGKLYVSYPMIEAVKHLSTCVDFKELRVAAKDKIGYKEIVHKSCDTCYQNLDQLQVIHWNTIITEHLKKLGFLMHSKFEIPDDVIEQIDIFLKQKSLHIDTTCEVAVLSSIPIFLADYYGYEQIRDMIS